ncbi:MAG: CpaF family protein [Firmicutes bacterium]|nr:CpaF family protein [Bacillota bacterium]
MPERLEFVETDWIEYERKEKERIIEEIAADLARQHPELFDGSLFGGEKLDLEAVVRKAVLAREDVLPEEVDEIVSAIAAQASGYGPLAEFFAPEAAEITEVLVNPTRDGPKVWYGRHGRSWPAQKRYFADDDEVREWARKVCEDAGRPFTADTPIVDAWLRDGSRINVIGFKASPLGTAVTIRKSPLTRPAMPLEKLVENGMMPRFVAEWLVDLLVRGHANLGVFGRTDSGKTTLLRALGAHIDPRDRTFIAETSFELFIPELQNAVNLVEVSYGGETVVDMSALCETMNRSNPDRAIVGEIRGKEIVAASQMATSTSGGFWTTGHAGNVHSLRSRIWGMFFRGGVTLPETFLDEIIASMFQFLIFVDKEELTEERKRTLMSVVEVVPGGGYRVIVRFDAERFAETGGRERRWICENPPTSERLAMLAFRGAKVRPEYRSAEEKFFYAEGGGR